MKSAPWLPAYTNETSLNVITCMKVEDLHNFVLKDTSMMFAYICFIFGIITGCFIYLFISWLVSRGKI
jgi:hypothetical protein